MGEREREKMILLLLLALKTEKGTMTQETWVGFSS